MASFEMNSDQGTSPGSGPAGDGSERSTATSRELLERVKADDAAAWDRLIGLYAPLVYRWCRRWDLPQQESADILQDVFQAVAASIGSFRREKPGDTFRGWLRTIARNKVRDYFRKAGREQGGAGGTEAQIRLAGLPAMEPGDPDDSSGNPAGRGAVSDALDLIRCEFEDRTWRAFWLTAVEDRVPKEVAIELGMSPGAVRVAKSRILRRLREQLDEL
jgi:RNA polymerase sigma-70 factor, ECF subfamily